MKMVIKFNGRNLLRMPHCWCISNVCDEDIQIHENSDHKLKMRTRLDDWKRNIVELTPQKRDS